MENLVIGKITNTPLTLSDNDTLRLYVTIDLHHLKISYP